MGRNVWKGSVSQLCNWKLWPVVTRQSDRLKHKDMLSPHRMKAHTCQCTGGAVEAQPAVINNWTGCTLSRFVWVEAMQSSMEPDNLIPHKTDRERQERETWLRMEGPCRTFRLLLEEWTRRRCSFKQTVHSLTHTCASRHVSTHCLKTHCEI